MIYQKPLIGNTPWAAHIVEMAEFPLHRHHEAEIVYCLEGAVTADVNGEKIEVNQGEMLYIASFASHSFESAEKTKAVVVEFGHALLKEDFFPFAKEKVGFRLYREGSEAMHRMAELTQLIIGDKNSNRLDILGELYKLAASLIRDMETQEEKAEKNEFDRIAPALQLIYMKYTQELKVEDACAETSLSPGNFCTLFKKATGLSFHAYLNSYRIQNVCYLLKQTEMSIEEIFSLSGFSDIKTFYRVFKKETGVSPGKYRTNHNL